MTLLGLAAGFFVFLLDEGGFFVQWVPLPPPPEQPIELIASREFKLWVETQSRETYRWNGKEWDISEIPADIYEGWAVQKPCQENWPAFFPFSGRPTKMHQCIQDAGMGSGGFYNRHVFAFDTNGQLWEWEHITHGLSSLGAFLGYTFNGGLVGLSLAILMLTIGNFLRKCNKEKVKSA